MKLWVQPDECCSTANDATADQRLLAVEAASEVMWAKTGRAFGEGIETVRPCRQSAGRQMFDLPVHGFWHTGSRPLFWGSCGCSSSDRCSCRSTSWVKLPRDKIRNVTEVVIDGEIIDPSEYRLRGRNRLYRRDKGWPCCQNLALDTTEVGTWEVSYEYGYPVPAVAKLGAMRLACETLKLLTNDPTCKLPANVRTATRSGLTFDLAKHFDPETGLTGLYEVDNAVLTLNPSGRAKRATAWSPELSGRAVRSDLPSS